MTFTFEKMLVAANVAEGNADSRVRPAAGTGYPAEAACPPHITSTLQVAKRALGLLLTAVGWPLTLVGRA